MNPFLNWLVHLPYAKPAAVVLAASALFALGLATARLRLRRDASRASGEGVELVGDVVLSGSASFPRGLSVRGGLTLAPDACVTGNVRTEGSVHVADGARLDGSLATLGSLRLGRGARVGAATVAVDAVVSPDARVEGLLSCDRLVLPPTPRPDEDVDEPEEGSIIELTQC